MKFIVPMSGQGSRFIEKGYVDPKPLVKIDNLPIIEHLMKTIPEDWPVVFICNEEHLEKTSMRESLEKICPRAEIVSVPVMKKGPVWAVYEALLTNPNILGDDENCLISYCDYNMCWDPIRFENFVNRTQCDGAVLCYTGFHPEYIRPTMYAYVKHIRGKISDIQEKACYTDDRTKEYASCGAYYFKSGKQVRYYFNKLLQEGPLLNGEGYVSLVYRGLLKDQLDIRVFEIPYFMQWGTPHDVEDYNYWSKTFESFVKSKFFSEDTNVPQLLMPMAGKGSRFGSKLQKPMIPVMGKEMYKVATEYLPKTTQVTYVVREEFRDKVMKLSPQSHVVSLDEVTEGQAITCMLGAKNMKKNEPLIVSSCDHGLVWNSQKWTSLLEEDPDVIVVGQRNYPLAEITPNSFAYISTNEENEIDFVSVKKPISDSPRSDLLLVGTFYFKSVKLMEELIQELVEKSIRVNNEFYLDSVVNLAVERKLKVKCFEAEGYLCWGTPDSLNEFNYWYSYFNGLSRYRDGEY
ncbi:MAG: NTP transferase domain-containing protein [Bdellovibrionales bacterium]|nr:NTP transferase domain-containing protein [Bdellovibrionales bacterium]